MRRRRAVVLGRVLGLGLTAVLVVVSVGALVAYALGVRVNVTASMPLGLYQVSHDSVAVGSLVRACLPIGVERAGVQRGYLPSGWCPGGGYPVLKRVAGLGGARYRIAADGVWVDGRRVAGPPVARDFAGRDLVPYRPAGFVPAGDAFLVGESADSWDSRYYGPVAVEGLVTMRVLVVEAANGRENPFFALWRPGSK